MISVGFKCPISLWRNFTASLHSLQLCFSSLRFVGISPYHLSQFKVWTLTILSHAWDHKPVSGLQPILSCLTDGFIFDFIIPLCTEDFRQFPVINTAFFPDMLLFGRLWMSTWSAGERNLQRTTHKDACRRPTLENDTSSKIYDVCPFLTGNLTKLEQVAFGFGFVFVFFDHQGLKNLSRGKNMVFFLFAILYYMSFTMLTLPPPLSYLSVLHFRKKVKTAPKMIFITIC